MVKPLNEKTSGKWTIKMQNFDVLINFVIHFLFNDTFLR